MSKLVRDGIPDAIKLSGSEPEVERVSGEWLKLALKDKLVEEACELRVSEDVYGELADVLEVVDAIVEQFGLDMRKLCEIKNEKRRRAGGFKEGFLLLDDDEKHKA